MVGIDSSATLSQEFAGPDRASREPKISRTGTTGPPGTSRYQPRSGGLFARIEHHHHDASDDFWQVESKDGLTRLSGGGGILVGRVGVRLQGALGSGQGSADGAGALRARHYICFF